MRQVILNSEAVDMVISGKDINMGTDNLQFVLDQIQHKLVGRFV